MKKFDLQRALAKSLFERGINSPTVIARHCKISRPTARRYLENLRRGESLADKPRSGRPRKVTSTFKRQLGQIKSQNPDESAKFYAEYISNLNGTPISATSVRRALHELGYSWRLKPRRELTAAQRGNRVAFAREHLDDSWDRVWFFDESYFNLYRNGNQYWVRAKTDEAMSLPKLTTNEEKVSVGIAVAISRGRKSALAFLPKAWKAENLVEVFETMIYPSLIWSDEIGQEIELVMDNDGRYFSQDWITYAEENDLRTIRPWPANSPDFNPIENVFAWLKREVQHRCLRSEGALKAAIRDAWDHLAVEITERLVESMSRRLVEAIRNKGERTKY